MFDSEEGPGISNSETANLFRKASRVIRFVLHSKWCRQISVTSRAWSRAIYSRSCWPGSNVTYGNCDEVLRTVSDSFSYFWWEDENRKLFGSFSENLQNTTKQSHYGLHNLWCHLIDCWLFCFQEDAKQQTDNQGAVSVFVNCSCTCFRESFLGEQNGDWCIYP